MFSRRVTQIFCCCPFLVCLLLVHYVRMTFITLYLTLVSFFFFFFVICLYYLNV